MSQQVLQNLRIHEIHVYGICVITPDKLRLRTRQ